MKHAAHGDGMLDLLHGDEHGAAECWLRGLLARRFTPRGHREHGGLGRHRGHLPRLNGHEAAGAQDDRAGG